MDLRDFFPSTTRERVRRIFGAVGYPERVASTLAALCTVVAPLHVRRQAGPSTGSRCGGSRAPACPGGANVPCPREPRRPRARPAAGGGRGGVRGGLHPVRGQSRVLRRAGVRGAGAGFVGLVDEIVRDEGYVVHPDKTRILSPAQRRILGGVVVNAHPNVPRDEYDRLKAVLHHCVRSGRRARTGRPPGLPGPPRGADRLGRPAEPGAGGEAPDDVRPDRVGVSGDGRWRSRRWPAPTPSVYLPRLRGRTSRFDHGGRGGTRRTEREGSAPATGPRPGTGQSAAPCTAGPPACAACGARRGTAADRSPCGPPISAFTSRAGVAEVDVLVDHPVDHHQLAPQPPTSTAARSTPRSPAAFSDGGPCTARCSACRSRPSGSPGRRPRRPGTRRARGTAPSG